MDGAGELVSFSSLVVDELGPGPTVECSHAPGSRLPQGITEAMVIVFDASGTITSAEFSVTVLAKQGRRGL